MAQIISRRHIDLILQPSGHINHHISWTHKFRQYPASQIKLNLNFYKFPDMQCNATSAELRIL